MLKNGLFVSGTKVELIDSGFKMLANTQGYLVGVSSNPVRSYTVTQSMIVTRRGKGGQPRLDLRTLSTPIFYLDGTEKKEEEY